MFFWHCWELSRYLKPVIHQQAESISEKPRTPMSQAEKVAEFADLEPIAFYQRREAVGVMDYYPRKIRIHRSNY